MSFRNNLKKPGSIFDSLNTHYENLEILEPEKATLDDIRNAILIKQLDVTSAKNITESEINKAIEYLKLIQQDLLKKRTEYDKSLPEFIEKRNAKREAIAKQIAAEKAVAEEKQKQYEKEQLESKKAYEQRQQAFQQERDEFVLKFDEHFQKFMSSGPYGSKELPEKINRHFKTMFINDRMDVTDPKNWQAVCDKLAGKEEFLKLVMRYHDDLTNNTSDFITRDNSGDDRMKTAGWFGFDGAIDPEYESSYRSSDQPTLALHQFLPSVLCESLRKAFLSNDMLFKEIWKKGDGHGKHFWRTFEESGKELHEQLYYQKWNDKIRPQLALQAINEYYKSKFDTTAESTSKKNPKISNETTHKPQSADSIEHQEIKVLAKQVSSFNFLKREQNRGKIRASIYKNLLQSASTTLEKNIILYALLKGDGKELRWRTTLAIYPNAALEELDKTKGNDAKKQKMIEKVTAVLWDSIFRDPTMKHSDIKVLEKQVEKIQKIANANKEMDPGAIENLLQFRK